jgi:hypothetical protein
MGEMIRAKITCAGGHEKRVEFRKQEDGNIMDIWKIDCVSVQ